MSKRAPADPADQHAVALKLWVVLSRAHEAIAAHAEADVARHGLTITEFGVLEALYHKGPMLLGEVQRRILVSSGGITFVIDRLVKKGLVERQTCETDRRARYAALTPSGEALIVRIFPAHAATIAAAVDGLPVGEQRELTDALRTLGLAAKQQASPAGVEAPPAASGRRPRSASGPARRRQLP
jgi:MarR family 2-MHQ and catechol resistance regulon transcriptional repressor